MDPTRPGRALLHSLLLLLLHRLTDQLTNGAPSSLVEDAPTVATDKVRHARTSFDIAGALIGAEVKAGPLSESRLEYMRDAASLGLAVAREGCVDETLSAIGAAVESLESETKTGKYKHAKLDENTASWISRELRDIAMEEASHSALAWRTLFWVCTVDKKACEAVKREALDAAQLELRFSYRFARLFENEPETLEEMRVAWKRVTQRLVASLDNTSNNTEMDNQFCLELEVRNGSENDVLLDLMNSILRGALC